MKNKLIILTFFLVLNTGASFSQGILTRIGEKIPNVEADYYAGKKWLAFFHVDFVPGFSAGMTIWIDMDDYMGITEEGKQGWVTLWFDETFGIAPKPVAFGCLPREYDLNTPDSPTYFLNLEGNASIPGFTALSMGVSAGPDEIAHIDYIDFLEDFYYDVSASLSVHVISLEVQKGPLDILLAKSLVPGAKVSAVTNLIFNVIAAEGSAWKYILNCAPRRATLQDDPSSSLTQAIRYDNLIVGEPGKVYVDVLVRESDIYYERIWDDDGVLPPRWDWVESESELVYLYAGDYHTFEFWVYPTDTEEQFAFWLYQRDLLGGYQIIEKALIDEPLYALPAGTDLKKPEISDILFLNKTNSNIGIAFNEPILEYSINEQTIKIIGQNGLYNYNFQILGNGDEVLIDPISDFQPGETITLEITTFIKDLAGNRLQSGRTKTYTIEGNPPAPPTSMATTISVSPNTNVPPLSSVNVSGTAIYNTGTSVTNGTVSITSGSNTYTTTLNDFGYYTSNVAAPSTDGYIYVSVSDGILSPANNQAYIDISENSVGNQYDLETYIIFDSEEIDGRMYGYSKDAFKTTDEKVELLATFENMYIDHDLDLERRFYMPNGMLLWKKTSTDVIKSDWNWGWETLGQPINGYTMSHLPGLYNARFYVDGDREATHNYSVAWDFTEHRIAKDIIGSTPLDAEIQDGTATFTQADDRVYCWGNFDLVAQPTNVRWIYTEPNGSQFTIFDNKIDDPDPTNEDVWWNWFRVWSWVRINGGEAQNKCGLWEVSFEVLHPTDGTWDTYYRDNFQILESPGVDPVINVTVQNKNEDENILVNLSGSDNTYITDVTFYYRVNDGEWQETSWNNIYSSSFTQTNIDIGVFNEGDVVEVYAKIMDSSGNDSESTRQTIIIRDTDTEGPSITNVMVTEYNGGGAGNQDGIITNDEPILLACWALDPSGVQEVNYIINNKEVYTAFYNSGYFATIDSLPVGSYILEVVAVDNDDSPATSSVYDDFQVRSSTPLVSDFSASPLQGNAELEVTFSDNSTGNPDFWEWSFGDGETSALQNPVHTYSDPGLHHVRLIVYNNFEGDTLVKENYIEVIEQPLIIQDSLALVALYNSTDGPNWTNNENWLTAEPISSWYGITVENGRVTSIHLSFNNLTGYLPPEIGQLTELVDLIIVSDMSENSISGNIPFEIGLLGNLVNLNLMQNRITGSIPVETGQLLHLEHLDLRSNLLTGSIPSELGQLENLQWLFLYRNQLSGNIPNELGQLSNLSLIEMSDNQLSGSIPTEIGQLTNLSSFTVGSNNLSGVIPAGLCNLPLEWVNFENNQFDSESCPTIQCLIDNNVNFDNDPDQTQQSGFSLMNDCGEEFNLQTDSLALVALYNATDGPNWTNNENWLTGPLNTWHGVKVETDRVTELLIGQNNLNGYIPPEIGQLTMINRIFIEQNNLAGAIPEEIGQLTNLNYLYLRDNQLTGEIPSTLYQLTNLTRLNLGDNQLIGILTPEIGLLSNLVELHLHGNNLTGTIPSELGKLKKLDQLGFNNNQFSGTLPVELAGLDSLMYLGLGANQLTGSIPSEYGQLEKIWNIELFSNQLSGEIPDELGQLISIRILNLAENQLLGTIPSSFGQLIYLRDLNLRRNEISGKIPEEFGQLTNLEWLLLGDNHLIDTVPLVLNTLVNLRGLGVENNFINYLPDFSSTPNLSNLYCENNRLDFGDLEPNIEILSYTYSPQDSIGQNIDTILQLNENFEFQLETGGSHNLYQWYKEGVLLPAQTTETLNIESLTFADAGSYQCEVTNSLVTGLTLHSRLLNIAVVENQCQIISLNAGWNIFSSVVTPDPAELQFNFQSLIDNNSLVKVQDEGGWSLEDHGIYGGWQNDIGNISPAEGYKVKVNTNTELQMCGNLVEYPYRIYLFEGWNIMGYPQMQTVDAMEVVQQLVDRGLLVKVQDERGSSIEDLGIFGGWQNFIGNFQPGEGYKIKVSSQDSLWIYESYPKSTVTLSKPLNLQHFNIAISGNGVDHMNFNLVNVNEKLLAVGDEISVYDGTTCAGAMVVTEFHLRKGIVSIPASATDESGMPGFTKGNKYSLRIWKADQNREIEVETEHISGPEVFTKHESVILSLDKSALTNTDEWNGNGSTEVNCYPNPFNQEITIELMLTVESKIQVVVLNQMGQEVKYLATKSDLNSGIHRLTWDGSNSAGDRVPHGMYYLKIVLDDLIISKKIVYNKH